MTPDFLYRNPDLANTFEALVKEGPALIYRGDIAQMIAGRPARRTAVCSRLKIWLRTRLSCARRCTSPTTTWNSTPTRPPHAAAPSSPFLWPCWNHTI